MKYINDCTIEELQERIKELQELEKNKKLNKAVQIVQSINGLLKEMEGLGYTINTRDYCGDRMDLEEIIYEGAYNCFSVKEVS